MIEGKWEWIAGGIIYDFHNNGTYDYFNAQAGRRVNARYRIEGNIIRYIDIGTAQEFSLSADGKTLSMKFQGSWMFFNRIG